MRWAANCNIFFVSLFLSSCIGRRTLVVRSFVWGPLCLTRERFSHTPKARKDALVRRYQTLLQCTRSIRSFNTLLHSASFNNRSRRRSSGGYLKPDRNIENRSDHFSASIIDRLSVFFHSAILVPTISVSTISVLTVCVFKISLNFKTLSKWLLFFGRKSEEDAVRCSQARRLDQTDRPAFGKLEQKSWTRGSGKKKSWKRILTKKKNHFIEIGKDFWALKAELGEREVLKRNRNKKRTH